MKKVLSFLLLVCCLATLCACGGKNADASSANKIVYGEKYVSTTQSKISERTHETYYVIEKDCLKKYRYDDYRDNVWHYVATFKYEIIDEGKLVYFFDSIEIYEDDNKTEMEDICVDTGVMEFSENVLIINDEVVYVRESYLEEELTNFGKPQ